MIRRGLGERGVCIRLCVARLRVRNREDLRLNLPIIGIMPFKTLMAANERNSTRRICQAKRPGRRQRRNGITTIG